MNTFGTYIMPARFTDLMLSAERNEAMVNAHMQIKTRPKIDDVVCHQLDGDTLKEALFIIDNIREHKMKIKWSSVNVWLVSYRGKHVCDIRIGNDSLHIGQVSGVLAIRVTNMSYDRESLNRLIEALRDSISGAQEPVYALQ